MSGEQISPFPYEGFDPKYDFEVDKETGCYMKGTFTMPESDWCFLYHDAKYHFWFYAKRTWEGRVFDVTVSNISGGKFRDHLVVSYINFDDLPVIKRNMEKYFQQRDFLASAGPKDPKDVFRSLRFEWAPHV